jgi:hypothetical protein
VIASGEDVRLKRDCLDLLKPTQKNQLQPTIKALIVLTSKQGVLEGEM